MASSIYFLGVKGKKTKKHRAHDSGWGVGWLGGCCGVVLKVVDFGAGR